MRTATGRLESKLDGMLETHYRNPANRRLARHLKHERPWLFTFLYCPGLDATNNTAERAIRGMVIARKVWGGNRTWEGARTEQILVSVLRTFGSKQGRLYAHSHVAKAESHDHGHCAGANCPRHPSKLMPECVTFCGGRSSEAG
jgi:hypothetical protein